MKIEDHLQLLKHVGGMDVRKVVDQNWKRSGMALQLLEAPEERRVQWPKAADR